MIDCVGRQSREERENKSERTSGCGNRMGWDEVRESEVGRGGDVSWSNGAKPDQNGSQHAVSTLQPTRPSHA